eukprot:3570765-Amphidinium_carterae.1
MRVRCTGFRRAAHCTSTPRSLTVSSSEGRLRPRQERFTDCRATLPLTTTLVFLAFKTMPAVVMAWRTSLKAKRRVLPQFLPVAYKTKSSTYLRTETSRMLACPSTRERKQGL